MEDILQNHKMELRQVILGFILTYRGIGEDAAELTLNGANAETPKINGRYISYDCPTFESPWLQGAFGSGIVTLTGPVSGSRLVLDFNAISQDEQFAP